MGRKSAPALGVEPERARCSAGSHPLTTYILQCSIGITIWRMPIPSEHQLSRSSSDRRVDYCHVQEEQEDRCKP
jgi:hypothetical protein